jgi:peptidoglycan/xylan/chitin deacetylase (PgdA/CDA1 family)
MQVHVTFDVETWCDGWHQLDERFPAAFERSIVGRSAAGDYALPKTLEILNRHQLKGVFFVESLFAARFGEAYLQRVVGMLRDAGQDVQLHVHPEWADELTPPLVAGGAGKRPNLPQYSCSDQVRLIQWARQALESALGQPVTAFRAGNYSVNDDTYRALLQAGIRIDSSLNHGMGMHHTGRLRRWRGAEHLGAIASYPITPFRDGFGRIRPAQVGSCGEQEMRQALASAHAAGQEHFVIISHNFEMLRPRSAEVEPVVVRRFEALCQYLADHPDLYQVGPLPPEPRLGPATLPKASMLATACRHCEQFRRRLPAWARG